MSYLRGPLTKEQIETLTGSAPRRSAEPTEAPAPAPAPAAPAADESSVAPLVVESVPVGYLDPAAPWVAQIGATPEGRRLCAFLAARVSLRFDDAKAGIDATEEWEAVYGPLDGGLDLDTETPVDYDERDFRAAPPQGAGYVLPQAPLGEARFFRDATAQIQSARPRRFATGSRHGRSGWRPPSSWRSDGSRSSRRRLGRTRRPNSSPAGAPCSARYWVGGAARARLRARSAAPHHGEA